MSKQNRNNLKLQLLDTQGALDDLATGPVEDDDLYRTIARFLLGKGLRDLIAGGIITMNEAAILYAHLVVPPYKRHMPRMSSVVKRDLFGLAKAKFPQPIFWEKQ